MCIINFNITFKYVNILTSYTRGHLMNNVERSKRIACKKALNAVSYCLKREEMTMTLQQDSKI